MMPQGAASAPQLVQLYGYWYSRNVATGVFEKVPRMPSDLPQQLGQALHALSAIDEGMQPGEALSALSSSLVFVWPWALHAILSIAHVESVCKVIATKRFSFQTIPCRHMYMSNTHSLKTCILQ